MPFYVSPQTQQELAVDIEDYQESISFVNQNGITVKSDNFLVSPNYQCNSYACHLIQILYRPSEVTFKEYFFEYFNLIGRFQPYSNWCKNFRLSRSHLTTLNPKFKAFLAIKDRLNLSGILTNTFLGNYLNNMKSIS